jgi:peptidoglycan/LPS O-acetylase OafA/YrhL
VLKPQALNLMPISPPRLVFIDALRALASQLIVLHHLVFYGPMSDYARPLAPGLFDWFHHDSRIAVQVFLVIGGFLAAKSLAPLGVLTRERPLSLAWQRYRKLAIPYLVAVVLSIPCAAVARAWMTHDSIPMVPTVGQIVANVFLVQDLLGFDGLLAGGWYVAIDFQLFVLFGGCMWLVRSVVRDRERARTVDWFLVVGLTLASLFYFNRHAFWDVTAFYFFGAYGLGVLSFWVVDRKSPLPWSLLMVLIVTAALMVAWRSRIAVALTTALILELGRRFDFLGRVPQSRWIAWLGKTSYSLFLIHFPVCLLTNALWSRFAGTGPLINAAGVFIAWFASIAAGGIFYDQVERRLTGKDLNRCG